MNEASESHGLPVRPLSASLGVVCALPAELGPLAERVCARRVEHGLELSELELDGARVLAAVGGVGKVSAARAASILISAGARRLVVVGVGGALVRSLATGALVHCTRAAQTDLAVRAGREVDADLELRTAWQAVAPAPGGWFLTADRPVLTPWRRLRLARAFRGPCIADMETAAVAAVARAAGVPWAALRAVSDLAGFGTAVSFRSNFHRVAGLAAATVPALCARLVADSSALPPDVR